MALNNIKREPKRELIESGIGTVTVLVVLPLYLYVCHAIVMYLGVTPADWWAAHIFMTIILPLVIFIGFLGFYFVFLYLPHEIGEIVCAMMKDLGFDPRPKYRPGTKKYTDNGVEYVTKESW